MSIPELYTVGSVQNIVKQLKLFMKIFSLMIIIDLFSSIITYIYI